MLRIRLTRTGRAKQESFRIVVAEHARPVKGKFIEILGHYQGARQEKPVIIKKERIEYWMTKGAQPSGSVASLLKKHGFANMDQYLEKRNTNIKKKSEMAKEAADKANAAPVAKAEPKAEAKA